MPSTKEKLNLSTTSFPPNGSGEEVNDMEFDYSNEPSSFSCPACPSTFVTRISLARHMIYHVNDPKFSCNFCEAVFYQKDLLADHISSKHGGAKFSCNICHRNVSRRDHLSRHYRNVHGFDSGEVISELNASENRADQETIINRESKPALERAIVVPVRNGNGNGKNWTLNMKPAVTQTMQQNNEASSDLDEDEFEESEDDYPPMNGTHPNSMLEITVGEQGRGSNSKYVHSEDTDLNEFYNTPQFNAMEGIRTDRKRQCPQCSASFTNQYNLDRHVESHNSTRPHQCTICPDNRGFIRKEHLTKHMSSVHSGMKFTCEYCGKDISRKDHLIRHIKNVHPAEYLGIPPEVAATHDIDMSLTSLRASGMAISEKTLQSMQPKPKKPYMPCDMCSETFTLLNELLEHQRTAHSDVRKYTCDYCPKSFKRREHLQKHIVLHTGCKDFSCDSCGKEFPRKDALHDHIRRIHGPESSDVVEFTCKYCEKKFLSKANLRRHIETSHERTITSSIPKPEKHKLKFSEMNVNSSSAVFSGQQIYNLSGSILPPVPSLFPITGFGEHSAFSQNVFGGIDMGLFGNGNMDNFSCAHCTATFSEESIFKQHLSTHRLK